MTTYILILYFSCAPARCVTICDANGANCKPQTSATLSQRFDSYEKCMAAGRAYLVPAANPTGTIKSVACRA